MDEQKPEVPQEVKDAIERFHPAHPELAESVKEAIAKYREDFKEKSFSGRHPELGKMVNCQFCDRRHRTAEICLQRFAKDENGVERLAKGYSHGRGRLRKRWNKRELELVDLTRQLLPYYPSIQAARSKALNTLRKKWHAESQRIQQQQKLSRKINRG